MGRNLKLPKYVHAFVDRHGKPRYYLRRPGFSKRIALPGIPYSPEFMEAYSAGIEGTSASKREIGADRTKPGTISSLVVAYYKSDDWLNRLTEDTRKTRRRIIERVPSRMWLEFG